MSGIPAWAVPGRKVVCVDTDWYGGWQSRCPLSNGGIYTIAEVNPPRRCRDGKFAGVLAATLVLVEVDNPESAFNDFNIYRFRPAVEDSDENGIEATLYRQKGLHSKLSKREVADA